MARRVIMHVGVPKTGTSYVQDKLFNNPVPLAEQGIAYPAERHDAQFLAALDLMQLTWGGLEREAVGSWQRLVDAVVAAPGTAVISHEILGFASRAHVERALGDLGATGAELHVVVSARDLVRQIPAEWQENVKHRRTTTYADFLRGLRERRDDDTVSAWFWGVQDVPEVLARWGDGLPVDRVHVVSVPQPGAPRDLLWQRFAAVLGVRPDSLPAGTHRENASLGVAETALVRRLNERLNEVVPNERYRQFVREHLVHQTLSREQVSARLSVPPEVFAWAQDLGKEWVATLADRGYDVIGDLDDLLPGEPPPWVDPDRPDEAQVAEAGVRGLDAMTRAVARLRDVEIELHQEIADRDREIADYHATVGFRTRSKLVHGAQDNALARGALTAYRRLRRR